MQLQLYQTTPNPTETAPKPHQNPHQTHPPQVVLISIPSVVDPSMAPAGKHCLHAYLPATEPFALWEGLDRKRWAGGWADVVFRPED
jgi:phytoene dehydrogenase-like protein